MKKLTVSQDDPLETRVHDLELEAKMLRSLIRDLDEKIEGLSQRLKPLAPQRHHCRWCKGLIHPLSEVCGSCGRSLRVPENPRKGQPR